MSTKLNKVAKLYTEASKGGSVKDSPKADPKNGSDTPRKIAEISKTKSKPKKSE